MKKTLFFACIATLFSFNTNAQYYQQSTQYKKKAKPEYTVQQPQYHNQKSSWRIRPVVGFDYSYSMIDSDASFWDDNYSSAIEDKYDSLSLAGGVKINQNFGIELFYQQSSKEKGIYDFLFPNDSLFGIDTIHLKYKAYGVDFIGYLPFHKKFDLIGSIGIAQYELDTTYSEDYFYLSELYHHKVKGSDNNIGFRIGAGIQAYVTDNISFRLMAKYQHTDLNASMYDGDCKIDLNHTIDLTAGLRFYFL